MHTTLTANELTALIALRENVESATETRGGVVWGSVYLANARPRTMNAHAWAAVLGSLAGKGLYRVEDGDAFGLVVLC